MPPVLRRAKYSYYVKRVTFMLKEHQDNVKEGKLSNSVERAHSLSRVIMYMLQTPHWDRIGREIPDFHAIAKHHTLDLIAELNRLRLRKEIAEQWKQVQELAIAKGWVSL